jgi:hypothetical protein
MITQAGIADLAEHILGALQQAGGFKSVLACWGKQDVMISLANKVLHYKPCLTHTYRSY